MTEELELTDLVEQYSTLELSDKRRELGKEITETMIVLKKLIDESDMNANLEYDKLDEYTNLYQTTTSEDDYLTGLYEVIMNMKELLAIYLSKF